jgi:hypothetical protein
MLCLGRQYWQRSHGLHDFRPFGGRRHYDDDHNDHNDHNDDADNDHHDNADNDHHDCRGRL